MPLTHLPSTMRAIRGIEDIGFPSMSRAMAIGISFAIAGNILISFALNLQKLAHARLEAARSERRHGQEALESEGDTITAYEVGSEVQPELSLPPDVEREARVWHGNSSEAGLPLGPRLETDPLMALPPTASMEIPPIAPTYGALFPSTYEGHIRGVSPLRRHPKTAKQPGEGDGESLNGQTYHGPNNETDYLKSKLWYALHTFDRTVGI